MELDILSDGSEYISASRAAKKVGYSADYIGQLCRAQKIPGKFIGRTWYVEFPALVSHKQNRQLGRGRKAKIFSQHPTPAKPGALVSSAARKFSAISFSYEADDAPFLPALSKGVYIEKPRFNFSVAKQAVSLALAFVIIVGAGTLMHRQELVRFSFSQPASVSLLGDLVHPLKFLVDGFKNLKNVALSGFAPRTNTATGARFEPEIPTREPTPARQAAVVQSAPSVPLDYLKEELRAEFQNYIDTQLSSAKPPVAVYQSGPTYNINTVRREILLADTRPTVSRQSSSDVERFSSDIDQILNGGSFVNATLSGSLSGTGDFSVLAFGIATGTSATTTNFFATNASTTDFRSNIGFIGSLTTNSFTASNATSSTFAITGDGSGLTFYGSGNHDITAQSGTLRIGSNTIIGNIQALDDSVDIGTAGVRFDKIYANEVNATTLVGTLTGGNLTAETFSINSDNATADAEDAFLAFERGTLSPNALLRWDSTNDNFEFNNPLLILGSTTLQNFTFQNATGTNATTTNFFSTTASSTNLFSTSLSTGLITSGDINGQTVSSAANFTGTLTATGGLATLANLLLTGSSTLQNFTFQNATGTSATTTNLHVSGLASTTELRANTAYFGGSVGIGTTTPPSSFFASGSVSLGDYMLAAPNLSPHRIAGDSIAFSGSGAYGNYGSVIFHANGNYGGNSRRYMLSNAVNAGDFAIIKSDNNYTDPAVGTDGTITSGSVEFLVSGADGGGVGVGTTTVGQNKLRVGGTNSPQVSTAVARLLDVTGVINPYGGVGEIARFDGYINTPGGGNDIAIGVRINAPVISGTITDYASSLYIAGAPNIAAVNGSFALKIGSGKVDLGSGLVGIGTSSPSHQLTIASSTGPQLTLTDGVAGSAPFSFRQIGSALYIATSSQTSFATSTNNIFILDGVAGRVGVGSSTPMTLFAVAGTSTLQDILPGGTMTNNTSIYSIGSSTSRWNELWAKTLNVGTSTWSFNNGTNGRLSIFDSASGGGNERLTISTSGNVGIGTTSPQQDLHISGTTDSVIRLERTSLGTTADIAAAHQDEGFIIRTRTAQPIRFATNTTSGDWTNNTRMIITSGGNVGIGTTAQYPLHVVNSNNGDYVAYINNTSATPYGIRIQYGSASPNSSGQEAIIFFDQTTSRFVVASNGNVTNSNNSYGAISDMRLKENIQDGGDYLDILNQVQIKKFSFISDHKSEPDHLGVIAQELEIVLPDLVDTGSDGYKSVAYSKFVPMLVKAIQEVTRVSGVFKDSLIVWLADAANGITEIIAGTFRAKDQLCINNTCVTETQLQTLLAQAGSASGGSGGATTYSPVIIETNSSSSTSSTAGAATTTGSGTASATVSNDTASTTPSSGTIDTSTPTAPSGEATTTTSAIDSTQNSLPTENTEPVPQLTSEPTPVASEPAPAPMSEPAPAPEPTPDAPVSEPAP